MAAVAPATLAHASPNTVLVDGANVPSPFTAEGLADAIRIRLPGARVDVGACSPAVSTACVAWSAGDSPALVVKLAGREDLSVPLETGDPQAARRRAAILVAMALERPPMEPPPPASTETAPPRVPLAASVVAADVPSTPDDPTVIDRPPDPPRWAVGAVVGPAFTIDGDRDYLVPALTLWGRRYLTDVAFLEVGAKLAGAYTKRLESLTASVSDRAFHVGVGYVVPWSSFSLDVGVALSYTHPVVDVDGEGQADLGDRRFTSRLGARVGADLRWHLHPSLALVTGAATTFSFSERDFAGADGRDVIELGPALVDITFGAEVRF